MKRLGLAVLGAVLLCGSSAFAQDAAAGKKIYDSKECAKCHIVAGKGNKIGPLDGVATKMSEADMRKWLTNPLEMERTLEKKPKVKMSSKLKQMGLKESDIDALIAYLKTLTKK